MYKKQIAVILTACILLACPSVMAQQQRKPLTNADIIIMMKAGLPESTIVLEIEHSTADFDTSPEALIQLKNQGAGPKILDAILLASPGKLEAKRSSSSTNPLPKSVHKIAVKDFVFEIDSCKLSKDGVVCEPTVTNSSSEDRELSMSFWASDPDFKLTRIVDEFGTEYIPQYIHLGSVTRNVEKRGCGGCIALTNTVVPRVPMKIKLAFADVNPEANTIALLRVYFMWKDDPREGKLSADLRNIPIIR